MRSIQTERSFGPTSEAAIAELEQVLGVRLPEDYRQFLLEHNGGHPSRSQFHLADQPDQICSVAQFYGLGKRRDRKDLRKHISGYEGMLPPELLPIGHDPGSNLICMAIRGDTTGAIYFSDTEDMPVDDELPSYDQLGYVAASFTEFLDSLREDIPPDETEADRILRTNDLAALVALLDAGYDVESADAYDRTMMEKAVIEGRKEIVELLYQRGAKLRNARRYALRNRPLFPKYREVYDLIEQLHRQEKAQ